MSVKMSSHAKPVNSLARMADVMLPPRAPLTMPKQVLTAPPGGFIRAVRNLLWALAPGLRRLG